MTEWSDFALIFRDFEKTYPVIERGEGVYLYDENGKKYIDASSGSAAVSSIGHGVEEVAQAIEAEIRKFAYCPCHCFANRPSMELAERLATLAPEGLTKVWLVSDGSEATEAAVKLARQFQVLRGHRSKSLIISRWQSYHGATLGALSWSGVTARRSIYHPILKDTPHIAPAYCYRCDFDKTYPECGIRCAKVLEKTIQRVGAENVAAFIAEPVVGAALGAVPPPDEYFPIIRAICDKYEVVFIADEVMTGFGRTGEMFGIDHWNVVPDMIACAKGISGGYVPLGAVLVHEKILEEMKRHTSNIVTGHTYSAHHVIAASALASIKYILDNDLVQRTNENGPYMLEQMKNRLEHSIVGDVRGKGLFMGIEFVKDKATKKPFDSNEKIAGRIGAEALRRGLIVYPGSGSVDGTSGDHILIAPPLIISRSEIDQIALLLDQTIGHIADQVVP
jgi:adenosylmethionine-8-amino-7-oxononanoate aminotransferase